jgi:hypothetical protein
MKKQRRINVSRQDGFTIVYMAVILTTMLLFTGVAVDSGRAEPEQRGSER